MNDIKKTQTLVLIALWTASITAVTVMIQIPIPIGGYFNLSDVLVLLSVFVLPFRGALLAVSVGTALADILVGAASYAIFTFFIKAMEAAIVYYLWKHFDDKKRWIPFGIAAIVMAFLYGLVDGFLTGNAVVILTSTAYNAIQAILNAVLATLLYPYVIRLRDNLRG